MEQKLTKNTHVDDFIDYFQDQNKSNNYARYWLFNFRLAAVYKMIWDQFFLHTNQLYCTFDGTRWRVTGCSRMGDVWLTSDFNKDHGYDKRISISDCLQWSNLPTELEYKEI